MVFLMIIAGLVATVTSAVVGARRISIARDPGRVIYRTTVELLKTRAIDWERQSGDWGFCHFFTLPDAGICLRIGGYDDRITAVEVRGKKLKPRFGWLHSLERARKAMEREKARYAELTLATEAMESLGEANVIPLRRA